MLRSATTEPRRGREPAVGLAADALRRRDALRPDRRPAPGAVPPRAGGTPRRKRRSRPWSSATGRWCWASAGRCWAIGTTPRTPARPPSWSWRGGPGRSGGGIPWRAGCTAWPVGSHCGPGATARRRELERRRLERIGSAEPVAAPPAEPWPELYEELDRLPEPFRAAVVLCDLEGHSYEQAAGLLRLPGRDGAEPAGAGSRAAPPPPRTPGDRAGGRPGSARRGPDGGPVAAVDGRDRPGGDRDRSGPDDRRRGPGGGRGDGGGRSPEAGHEPGVDDIDDAPGGRVDGDRRDRAVGRRARRRSGEPAVRHCRGGRRRTDPRPRGRSRGAEHRRGRGRGARRGSAAILHRPMPMAG